MVMLEKCIMNNSLKAINTVSNIFNIYFGHPFHLKHLIIRFEGQIYSVAPIMSCLRIH
jgi:hypothetical protein